MKDCLTNICNVLACTIDTLLQDPPSAADTGGGFSVQLNYTRVVQRLKQSTGLDVSEDKLKEAVEDGFMEIPSNLAGQEVVVDQRGLSSANTMISGITMPQEEGRVDSSSGTSAAPLGGSAIAAPLGGNNATTLGGSTIGAPLGGSAIAAPVGGSATTDSSSVFPNTAVTREFLPPETGNTNNDASAFPGATSTSANSIAEGTTTTALASNRTNYHLGATLDTDEQQANTDAAVSSAMAPSLQQATMSIRDDPLPIESDSNTTNEDSASVAAPPCDSPVIGNDGMNGSGNTPTRYKVSTESEEWSII